MWCSVVFGLSVLLGVTFLVCCWYDIWLHGICVILRNEMWKSMLRDMSVGPVKIIMISRANTHMLIQMLIHMLTHVIIQL